jgi:DNA-binding response OmpR family regulator
MRQRGLGANEPLPDYDDGRLRIRPADYVAAANGVVLPLKLRELGLLAALANSAGRVVTRAELLERVWESSSEEITPRAVDACVARIRAVLSVALPAFAYIHTHARIGYRFAPERVVGSQVDGVDAVSEDGTDEPLGETASPSGLEATGSGNAGVASNL